MITPKSGTELLAALIDHKVDGSPESISHCEESVRSSSRQPADSGATRLTEVQVETGIEAHSPSMAYDVGHGFEGALVLVAGSHSMAVLHAAVGLGELLLVRQENRDLGTQLGQLEGARDDGDTGAGRGTGGTEASNGVHVRVCALLVHVLEDVKAGVLLDPARIGVFRSLVDRE